jgi:hypothetical protein
MPTPKTIPKSKFIQVGQNLQRYVPTGTYYARIRVAGKLHKKSLGTTVLTIAKLKLGDFAKQLHTQAERQRQAGKTKHGDLTVAGAMTAFTTEVNNDADLKPRTKAYYAEIVTAISKTWPELLQREVRDVDQKECEAWANRLRRAGTGFHIPGTKAPRVGISSTRFNACLDILRRIFAPSVKDGIRYANPVVDIKKAKIRTKHLVLPSHSQFKQMITVIEGGQNRSRGGAEITSDGTGSGVATTGADPFTACTRGTSSSGSIRT